MRPDRSFRTEHLLDRGAVHQELPNLDDCNLGGKVGLFDLPTDRQLVDPPTWLRTMLGIVSIPLRKRQISLWYSDPDRTRAFVRMRSFASGETKTASLPALFCSFALPMTAVFGCHKDRNRPSLAESLGDRAHAPLGNASPLAFLPDN